MCLLRLRNRCFCLPFLLLLLFLFIFLFLFFLLFCTPFYMNVLQFFLFPLLLLETHSVGTIEILLSYKVGTVKKQRKNKWWRLSKWSTLRLVLMPNFFYCRSIFVLSLKTLRHLIEKTHLTKDKIIEKKYKSCLLKISN